MPNPDVNNRDDRSQDSSPGGRKGSCGCGGRGKLWILTTIPQPLKARVTLSSGTQKHVRTALDISPSSDVPFRDYRLQNVYLRTIQAQRSEIIALWREEGAVNDPAEAERRSHEVVFLVRSPSGELAGLSTVGLVRAKDGRAFYDYRMFLRKRDRVPNLMVAVVVATRDFLKTFAHPEMQPAGMLHINENPKLMRPGARKVFERLGYRYWGKTAQDEEVWAVEFNQQTRGAAQRATWREALKKLMRRCGRAHDTYLKFTVLSRST